MVMAQQLADPCARLRPHLRPQRHESIERALREHADLAKGKAAVLLKLPEIEHVVANRDADARRQPAGGEHAIGKILDREVGGGIDWNEGAEFWVVGMGHEYFLRHSGMVQDQTRNLEIPGSMLRIAPE